MLRYLKFERLPPSYPTLVDNMLIAGYNKDTVYNDVETVIDTLVHDG